MTTPMPVAPRVDVDQYRRRGRRGAAMAVGQTLLTLREQYAAELDAGGTPALVVPTQDDIPITERMGWQGEDCVVAAQLAQPPGR